MGTLLHLAFLGKLQPAAGGDAPGLSLNPAKCLSSLARRCICLQTQGHPVTLAVLRLPREDT